MCTFLFAYITIFNRDVLFTIVLEVQYNKKPAENKGIQIERKMVYNYFIGKQND